MFNRYTHYESQISTNAHTDFLGPQNSIFPAAGPPPQIIGAANVIITPSTFNLRPGQSRTVVAFFSAPRNLDATRYPVYSGFIQIASPGENHHVSYLGLAASLKRKQVVDNTDVFFGEKIPTLIGQDSESQTEPKNYTFVGEDFPTFVFR